MGSRVKREKDRRKTKEYGKRNKVKKMGRDEEMGKRKKKKGNQGRKQGV